MNYIKTLSQQKLCLLLGVYIGWFLNISVFYQRFDSRAQVFIAWKGMAAAAEFFACLLVTFFLLRLLSIFGRHLWRVLASFVVLCSVAASYYMTFFNVVIGYGIIASVMTTDIDLSKEVVGYHFAIWMVLVSAIPLFLIWVNRSQDTLLQQLKTPGQRIKNIAILLCAGLLVWAPLRMLGEMQSDDEQGSTTDMASYGGVVASSYVPVNWVSSPGAFCLGERRRIHRQRRADEPHEKSSPTLRLQA
ncbi:Phosphoethanolamine transferase eptB [Cedecea neteri]|uniref:Phosphoethanolamine transferase eptB n=1 Tax=Cedecea neteri TaxID=158822 RepID=A0A2X2T8J4_9ENTR|nr:Phosphoethanolamine transferase eptB [Cedecea neteri]